MFSKLSIQVKYSLIFIITLAMISAGLLFGIHTLKKRQLRNEATATAEQVVAFRAWVANTGVVWVDHLALEFGDYLGKRVSDDNSTEYFSKNPALATRELSQIVSNTATRATFRVTSDEYRNAANAPDGFESHSLQAFKNNRDLTYNDEFEGDNYRYAQPILVKKACLKCHGDPADAPPDVIQKYGSKQAFGYEVGDVRGIISVKLPDVTLVEVLMTFLNPYTIGLIVLAFLMNFLYTQRALIRRLRNLAKTTERIARGELELPLNAKTGSKDEVDVVQHAVDLLRNSVVVAMKRMKKTAS